MIRKRKRDSDERAALKGELKGEIKRELKNSFNAGGALVDEAKVDKLKPEHERATVRDKRYDNPTGALELGGGIRRARRAAHRERDEMNKDKKDVRKGKTDGPQFQGKTGSERLEKVKKALQNNSFEPEGESVDERTRYAKETGKDPQTGKPSVKGGEKPDPAFAKVSAELRKTGGMMSSRRKPIQPQGKKKEKGKKGYQGVTPVDRIKGQLARKRAPKPDIGSRFD